MFRGRDLWKNIPPGDALVWEATLQLPSATALLYKYIITSDGTDSSLEEASPRLIEIEQDIHGKTVCIHDTWQVGVCFWSLSDVDKKEAEEMHIRYIALQ